MANPLIKSRPGSPALLLAPRCLAPAAWYALLAAYPRVIIDASMRHDKRRKEMHRYDIADTRGRLRLTVPVAHPASDTPRPLLWKHLNVSNHGSWWDVQRIAWESAYGRTPYFEFYIDRFAPLFINSPQRSIMEFNCLADAIVRSILDIPNEVAWRAPLPGEEFLDLRRLDPADIPPPPAPYWQVRQGSLGFIPNLSIIDLIFNLGPEAPFYLLEYDLTKYV